MGVYEVARLLGCQLKITYRNLLVTGLGFSRLPLLLLPIIRQLGCGLTSVPLDLILLIPRIGTALRFRSAVPGPYRCAVRLRRPGPKRTFLRMVNRRA